MFIMIETGKFDRRLIFLYQIHPSKFRQNVRWNHLQCRGIIASEVLVRLEGRYLRYVTNCRTLA